jgi:hypothetical protein
VGRHCVRAAWIAATLLLAACGKSAEPSGTPAGAPTPPPPPAPAAVPPPKPALVELLRAVPTVIRLSSNVANKRIRPEHMVDRDLQTAWNSVTGELVGTWIEINLLSHAAVAELQMTVGNTGKGPRGEDYFAMNHRIKKLSVLRNDKVITTATLDPELRALQTIAIPPPVRLADRGAGTLRIRIDEVVPGTRKAWREVCVSELEVWGTPPPGWTAPKAPLIPAVQVSPPASLEHLCDYAHPDEATRAASERERRRICENEGGSDEKIAVCIAETGVDIACSTSDPLEAALSGPWKGLTVLCERADSLLGDEQCRVVLAVPGGLVNGPVFRTTQQMGQESTGANIHRVDVSDVIPGDLPELLVEYGNIGFESHEYLIVCQIRTTAVCSETIEIGGETWRARPHVANGIVTLTADPDRTSNQPPPGALEPQRLVF